MRRGRGLRRIVSQPRPLRGQHLDHGRGRGPGRQSNNLSQSAPIRRSLRLNGVSPEGPSIENRSIEAEAHRAQDRARSRLLEETHDQNTSSSNRQTPQTLHSNNMRHDNHTQLMNGRNRSYTLEFAYPIPPVIQLGCPIYPPPAVRVHIHDNTTGNEIAGEDELNTLILSLSLTRSDGTSPSVAPPHESLMGGSLSATPNALSESVPNTTHLPLDEQQGSYAIFPNVQINRSGNYKLRAAVLGISLRTGARSVPDGATTYAVVESDPFSVQEHQARTIVGTVHNSPSILNLGADHVLDTQTQRFLNHIQLRGTVVPSAPS